MKTFSMSMISSRYPCKYVPGSGTPQLGQTSQMIYLFPLLSNSIQFECLSVVLFFCVVRSPTNVMVVWWCGVVVEDSPK